MGEIALPADRRWGAQTQRPPQNFRIGGERMRVPFTRALGWVKQAAAEVVAGTVDDRSPGGLADRLRHPVQHERQRGDRRPRQQARLMRKDGVEITSAGVKAPKPKAA